MNTHDVIVIGGLFAAAYFLQFYLSYLQMKHITKKYLELTEKYKGNYFIGMNKKRRFGCNPVVILVSDEKKIIQELYILKGLLVTSRMKQVDLKKEVRIDSLENHSSCLKRKIGGKGLQALQNAAENIMNCC